MTDMADDIARDRVDNLQARLSPDYWKRRGAPKGPR